MRTAALVMIIALVGSAAASDGQFPVLQELEREPGVAGGKMEQTRSWLGWVPGERGLGRRLACATRRGGAGVGGFSQEEALEGTSHSGMPTLFPASWPPMLAALYNVLNITGWDAYPDCWVFPQPAISLVFEDLTHLIAFTADEEDESAGQTVADAWCQ